MVAAVKLYACRLEVLTELNFNLFRTENLQEEQDTMMEVDECFGVYV